MGKIKNILSFLGMVFDIKDLASFFRRLFGLGGTASIITGFINFLLENTPMLSLTLIGVGIFCILLAIFPHILHYVPKQFGITPKPKPAKVSTFDEETTRIIDRAKKFKENPSQNLLITEYVIHFWNLEGKRPYITLQISYTNIGFYGLQIGKPEGFVRWKSDRLPERVQDDGGKNNVPVDVSSFTRFDVYLPQDFVDEVYSDISSPTGELMSLHLDKVRANIWVAGDSEPHKWSIAPPSGIFFRRRQ